MNIVDSSFYFIGANDNGVLSGRLKDAAMKSFADFALSRLHTQGFIRGQEVERVSRLTRMAGNDVNQFSSITDATIGINEVDKDDPIIDVINELLNNKEAYEAVHRRNLMLLLYQKGFYPKYKDVIRLPADILSSSPGSKGEPVRSFIEMDVAQCRMDFDDAKNKLLSDFPELEGVSLESFYMFNVYDRTDTILNERIKDPERWHAAKNQIIKLHELFKKVSTGPERNYPFAHFISKYNIVSPSTLTRTMAKTKELLDNVLGSYRNSVLGSSVTE